MNKILGISILSILIIGSIILVISFKDGSESNKGAEKLVGIWRGVQMFDIDSSTQQLYEKPVSYANRIYWEFTEDQRVCTGDNGHPLTCTPQYGYHYTIQGNNIIVSVYNTTETMSFKFVEDKLEITYTDQGSNSPRLIFEKVN